MWLKLTSSLIAVYYEYFYHRNVLAIKCQSSCRNYEVEFKIAVNINRLQDWCVYFEPPCILLMIYILLLVVP